MSDVFLGVDLEVYAPDQLAYPQAKLDGTTPWDGAPALVGDISPTYEFRQDYDPANPQPLVAVIDTPKADMSIRLRARSYSLNITNATGPEVVLTVTAPTAAKPGAATAYAPLVGGISATVGADYSQDGKLKTPIAVTVTGLPSTDPTWAGYVIVGQGLWGTAQVPITGTLSGSGQQIDLDTPASVLPVTLWAVSQSIDSTGTLVSNPIVPGITPSCSVSIGTTGGTVDPTTFIASLLNTAEFHVDPTTGLFAMNAVDFTKGNVGDVHY
jgi:hypothetical protein